MSGNHPKGRIKCVGEGVIDKISNQLGFAYDQVTEWIDHRGGAPPNSALAAALLGHKAAWLGCVSDNHEGMEFWRELQARGVDVNAVRIVPQPMRKAYVLLDDEGNRHFHHFTNGCADEQFNIGHLPVSFPNDADILHVGTISLAFESSAAATFYAIKRARAAGTLVSCDLNVRRTLWPSDHACRARCLEMLALADIVKMSREDLVFLTGDEKTSPAIQASKLWEQHKMPLLIVTLDREGAVALNRYGGLEAPAFKVDVVDSTGAGDAFNAGIFDGVIEVLNRPENVGRTRQQVVRKIVPYHLRHFLTRACGLGALACTKPGAWSALPDRDEWEIFLKEQGYAA